MSEEITPERALQAERWHAGVEGVLEVVQHDAPEPNPRIEPGEDGSVWVIGPHQRTRMSVATCQRWLALAGTVLAQRRDQARQAELLEQRLRMVAARERRDRERAPANRADRRKVTHGHERFEARHVAARRRGRVR